jgi:hypothetical protein
VAPHLDEHVEARRACQAALGDRERRLQRIKCSWCDCRRTRDPELEAAAEQQVLDLSPQRGRPMGQEDPAASALGF